MKNKTIVRCNNCGSRKNVIHVNDIAGGYDGYLCRSCINDPKKLAAFRAAVQERINRH